MTDDRLRQRKQRGYRKRRASNQIQGDLGESIVGAKFPPQWVVRKVTPDFGMDLLVEVFDEAVDGLEAETRGEHFYVQVKSVRGAKLTRKRVWHRGNVAKSGTEVRSDDSVEIEVLGCPLDTSELLTVEAMGSSVPVLLALVDIDSAQVWYVCLNDYLTKVLVPQKPNYADQDQITVHVPCWNVLDWTDDTFTYIWQLARRGKLYSAFNLLSYQHIEMNRAAAQGALTVDTVGGVALVTPGLLKLAKVFAESNLRLDVWEAAAQGYWAPLTGMAEELESLVEEIPKFLDWQPLDAVEQFLTRLEVTFFRGVNLGRMYEEVVREWRLPTALATLLDYAPGSAHNPPST